MTDKQLHIVCLDNPYPPDYGGSIDMYNRIVALYKNGIDIHLHFFEYNNKKETGPLQKYCSSITSYKRKTGWGGFSLTTPYIVYSRINQELIANLTADSSPVLLEGVHCSGIAPFIQKQGRKIIVRLHNDESSYYHRLFKTEKDFLKKIYFWNESRLLKKYQSGLSAEGIYACMTDTDLKQFHQHYHLHDVRKLPSSLAWQQLKCRTGTGSFCLYHGNLSVPENEEAAVWLIDKVFMKLKIPFVIAGKNPSKRLEKIAHLNKHTCLIASPSEEEINDLVIKAHINVLPSFNATGLKLKVLHALFEGRHCVTNMAAVEGTGLEQCCRVGDTAAEMIDIISRLYTQPFTEEEIALREKLLYPAYDNMQNARLLSQWLY
ncbi:MAG TPA: glycosyltransferase family 4 protein [Chitinophagaceae bacterium]|nr:glycosyltransferase family 4 protein [Chitinophagaceae bacterium]